jgi:hypothetical protein
VEPGFVYPKLNEELFRALVRRFSPPTSRNEVLLMYESLWTLPLAMILIVMLAVGIFRAMQPRKS